MNKKKEDRHFEADPYKNGYLRVPRSLLKQLYGVNLMEHQEASVWLCIQAHAYFQSGTVIIGDQVYPCLRGEWLTNYQEIADYTYLTRRQVNWSVSKLVAKGFITILRIKNKIRIAVSHYDKVNPNNPSALEPSLGKPRVQAPAALPPSEPQQPDEEKRERSGGYNFLDHLNNLMK